MFGEKVNCSRRAMIKTLGVACLVGALSACASAPPAPTFKDPRFTAGDAIPVRALRIEVDSTYQPSLMPPDVEHLVPLPPERVARQWVLDRLQPIRSGNVIAHFTIEDARITETHLKPKVTGVEGAFTDEPSERYDAYLKATLSYTDATTGKSGKVQTSAKYSMTVQENATLNEREQVWYKLALKLGETFDKAMVANIHQYVPELVAE